MTSQLDSLIEINTRDFLNAWGLGGVRFGRGLLAALARPAARDFAREVIAFDESVGEGGLPRGGLLLAKRYTAGLRAAGRDAVPRDGPTLILSNHPGLADTAVLFAAIARHDLRVLGLDRPFLRALPNTAQRMFLMPDDAHGRISAIRAAAGYLRQGGALLTFPAGQIEPDPLVLAGAVESLGRWSESISLFARLAPRARIVTAIVSGVLAPDAQRNPVIRLRRERKDREFLGATLQILWPPYRRNVAQVAFAPPMLAADLLAASPDSASITGAITGAARRLIVNPPSQWETIF